VRAKILAIDDEPEILELIHAILIKHDYQVITALDGPTGLAKFREYEPVLIILDVMMPRMDGWEVCKQLRQVSTVPIIFLTARGWHKDVIKGLELGADDYIAKPFSPQDLLTSVEKVFSKQG
jgi:DNA-binding response OmpR family regulator